METSPLIDVLLGDLESAHTRIRNLEQFRDYTARVLQPHTGDVTALSKQFEIPLQLEGVAIVEGEYNGIKYSSEELEKAAESLVGCPITVDHPIDSSDQKLKVRDEVGKITEAEYDSTIRGIRWKGFVVDEDIARRIFHNLVDSVSIGAVMDDEQRKNGQALDVKFLELSVVKNPACKGAKIEVLGKLASGGYIGIVKITKGMLNEVGNYSADSTQTDSTPKGGKMQKRTDREELIARYGKVIARELLNFIDECNEVETLGVIPSNPSGYKTSTKPWSGPTLGDFTAKSWDDLTTAEKRGIASHFAWARVSPPEKYGDLKLPHHDSKSHNVVWRGVAAAMAVLLGARGGVDIPDTDKRPVYNHLVKHYKDFDKEPPEFRIMEKEGGLEMAPEKKTEKETEVKPEKETQEVPDHSKKLDEISERVEALTEIVKKLIEKAEEKPVEPEPKKEEPVEEKKETPTDEIIKELKERVEKLESLPERISTEAGEPEKKGKVVTNADIVGFLKSKQVR